MSFEALLQTMGVGSAGSNSTLTQTAKDLGLPEDLMQMIEKQGLTPEIMQLLEESDDVPPETVEILKKLQEVQQQVPAEEVNEPTKPWKNKWALGFIESLEWSAYTDTLFFRCLTRY